MIRQSGFFIFLFSACQLALAEPQATPQSKTIVKSDGVEIGWLHEESTSYELFIVTAKNVIVPLTPTYNGDMMYGMVNANTHLRYQTGDCTGQAYASLRLDGFPKVNQEFAKTSSMILAATTTTTAIYYSVPPASVVSLQSKIDSLGNCVPDIVSSPANPVFLNDVSVTGVQFTTHGSGNPVLENLTTETR